jgi:DNA-binding NarL/FixJ family response regulator
VNALKILITEDEPILADELETIVTELGHHVVGVAATLKGTLQLAEQSGCDLALVDIYLRDGMTGPEIARQLAKSRHAAVIFTTSSPDYLTADLESACGVLAKPLSEQSIKSAIAFVNECLDSGRALHPKPRALQLSPTYADRWKVA